MICHLFAPGLFGPMPGIEHESAPALPRLEAVLARADRAHEPAGYAAALFALFGIATPDDADLPTAAVAYLADTGEPPAGFMLHADPLHLVPDRDHLLAFDLERDPLNDDELAELVAAFNTHFDHDGLRLDATSSGRLYLHCAVPASIRSHPLSAVIGRNLDHYLPDGDERARWHGLLNETQMLCYSLAFNQQREMDGRPTLGSLWFSGGGSLPMSVPHAPVGRLLGDCSVARGLLAMQATEARAASAVDDLIVEHALDWAVGHVDRDTWLAALDKVEAHIARALSDAGELHLHPCNGTVYRWTARSARRWWRRRRPLFSHLERGAAD